jgi:hypothetical protein
MDLTRIDGDHVAGFRFDGAAPAQRRLRALMNEPDAELLVGVARKGMARRGFDHVDAGNAARHHPELAFRHASIAIAFLR